MSALVRSDRSNFNLRPEMGNIFLFINVQDFLDSMVIHILGILATVSDLLRLLRKNEQL